MYIHIYFNDLSLFSALCYRIYPARHALENKESLNNRINNPYTSGAVTLSEIILRILTRFCRKIVE